MTPGYVFAQRLVTAPTEEGPHLLIETSGEMQQLSPLQGMAARISEGVKLLNTDPGALGPPSQAVTVVTVEGLR